MIVRNLILAALCALPLVASASSLEEGNRAYSEGDFAEAQTAYLKAIADGEAGANVWYNLGNARYRLNDKGQAAVAWERALTLNPGHPEARHNLDLLRRETGAVLPEVPLWQRAIKAPEAWLGQRMVPWVGAAAFWAALFVLLPFYRRGAVPWLSGAALMAVALWCGGAVALEVTQGARWLTTAPKGQARVAPLETARTVGAALPPASSLRLIQERGDWVYAELPDGSRGWFPRGDVEPIVPSPSGLSL